MQSAVQNKDQWSGNAEAYAKNVGNMKSLNAPVDLLFKQMDIAYPFTTAKAVLDVGSGPGVTLGRLIDGYGSELPADTRL